MNNKIRIGILGCGRAAELIYLPELLNHPDAFITAAVDPIKQRRDWIQSHIHNGIISESLNDEVINSIDAAIVCTTPETHVPLADSLLRCDKYVLVEKPLAHSLEGIDGLIHTLSKSTTHLLMGFNHRYWIPINKIKQVLCQQNGNIFINTCEICFTGNNISWNPVAFRSDSLEDLGPHVFDLISYLFEQEVHSVFASSNKPNSYNLNIKTSGGTVINAYIAHSNKTEKTIKISTDTNTYSLNLGSERYIPEKGIRRKVLDFNDKVQRKLLLRTSPIKRSYQLQLLNFFKIIRSAKPGKPDIIDGVAALKAVLAARLSIKRKEEVLLNEIQ